MREVEGLTYLPGPGVEGGWDMKLRSAMSTKAPHRRVPGLNHSQSIHRAAEYRTVMARGAER